MSSLSVETVPTELHRDARIRKQRLGGFFGHVFHTGTKLGPWHPRLRKTGNTVSIGLFPH
jgi:hypothetical protein